jgi:hypothetical protein
MLIKGKYLFLDSASLCPTSRVWAQGSTNNSGSLSQAEVDRIIKNHAKEGQFRQAKPVLPSTRCDNSKLGHGGHGRVSPVLLHLP